jgi:hypothetical protein
VIEQDRLPVEEALASELRAMRKDAARAAEADRDNFFEEWRTRALDARSLIVVGPWRTGRPDCG